MATMRGQPRILQFSINEDAIAHGRLNPHIPLERAGDCTANTLFMLDIISREIGVELSSAQTKCRYFTSRGFNDGTEVTPETLFSKYVYKSISKHYITLKVGEQEVLQILEELNPGQGTIVVMYHKDALGHTHAGHAVTVHRNREGNLEIIDLQNNRIIPFREFANYFQANNYNSFTLPSANLKRSIIENDKESKRARASVEGGKRKTNKKHKLRKTRKLQKTRKF
jgi:hypothetical protein